MTTQKTGVELIAEERHEQVHKHGFDLSLDDDYGDRQLVKASAACVMLYEAYNHPEATEEDKQWGERAAREFWPWQSEFGMRMFDKITRKSPIGMLRVAGAFAAAEIDRLQRLESVND